MLWNGAYKKSLTEYPALLPSSTRVENIKTPFPRNWKAMALLLSLGIATGSLSDVVRVAKVLLEGDSPPLPPSARPFVERLKNHSMPPKVGYIDL